MKSIEDLAELACVLPWESSRADVPYEHKAPFREAMTPELFLEMLEALRHAQEWTDPESVLGIRLAEVIAKATGGAA